MKTFWVSWWHTDAYSAFEIHAPWWESGFRGADSASSLCAAIRAPSEAEAQALVIQSYDTAPVDLEFRFVEERPDDWSPYTDRFRKADWMPEIEVIVASGEATRVGPQEPRPR